MNKNKPVRRRPTVVSAYFYTTLHTDTHIMWPVLRECSAKHEYSPICLPFQYQQEPSYKLTTPHRKTAKPHVAVYSIFFTLRSMCPTTLTNLPNSHNYSNFFVLLPTKYQLVQVVVLRRLDQHDSAWLFPLLWIFRNILHLVIKRVMTHFWWLGFGSGAQGLLSNWVRPVYVFSVLCLFFSLTWLLLQRAVRRKLWMTVTEVVYMFDWN